MTSPFDDDLALRRLSDSGPNMLVVDAVTGTRRPSSGAFMPDDDGLSVYLDSILKARGCGAKALVVQPTNLVVSLPVSEISRCGLRIEPDPFPKDVPDPGHCRHAAHALIVGWDHLSNGQRKRTQRALANSSALKFVFP